MNVEPPHETVRPQSAEARRDTGRRRSLLIVDDEHPVRENLAALLGDEFDVFTASGAIDAMAILHAEQVDIILSDYRMPGENGLSFLTDAARLFPRTVRVLMTAYGETGLVIQAVNEAGVYRFLSKPYRGENVITMMRQCAVHSSGKDPAPAEGEKKPLIAVAHPSAEVRNLVKGVLEREFRVLSAASGFELMEILGQKEVTGAVIGVGLDEIDSATISTYLRRRKRAFPVVVLGAAVPSLEKFVQDYGADLFADERDPEAYTTLVRHFAAALYGRHDASHRHED